MGVAERCQLLGEVLLRGTVKERDRGGGIRRRRRRRSAEKKEDEDEDEDEEYSLKGLRKGKLGHDGGRVGKGGWDDSTQGSYSQCWFWRVWDQLHTELGVQEAEETGGGWL